MHHPTDRIAHTTAFDTPVVEHWLEREIAQWVHPMKNRSDDPSHHERTFLPRSYIWFHSYKMFCLAPITTLLSLFEIIPILVVLPTEASFQTVVRAFAHYTACWTTRSPPSCRPEIRTLTSFCWTPTCGISPTVCPA